MVFFIFSTSLYTLFTLYHALGTDFPYLNCPLRLYVVSLVDRFYYPLTLFPLYLALGPWCIAELVREVGNFHVFYIKSISQFRSKCLS
jgi:hypothetical protein